MKKIIVPLKDRSYPILIDAGIAKQLPKLLAEKGCTHAVILTNQPLAKLYQKKIQSFFSQKIKVDWIVIPEGEKTKSIRYFEKIHKELIELKATRKTFLVCLGGGVIGDLGGFVASTYLRGIPFVQLPTSLLAMVDSSVGGKTAIDLPQGKNLVGTFYQPVFVLIDTLFLHTLPPREFRCGLAEVLKYGLLGDEGFFIYLEKNFSSILKLDPSLLQHVIFIACQMKADIVSKDEKESGLRALLNLGHTLAHAVETLSGYHKIKHGEAVAMGLVYAALLSEKRKLCSVGTKKRIEALLKNFGLPTEWPALPKADYERVMSIDKKSQGNVVQYVALKKIGKAFLLPLKVTEISKYL